MSQLSPADDELAAVAVVATAALVLSRMDTHCTASPAFPDPAGVSLCSVTAGSCVSGSKSERTAWCP